MTYLFKEVFITNYLHKGDLPADVEFPGDIALDTEAMGLLNPRDRLCVMQLSAGDGDAHLVQFAKGDYAAPNLRRLLTDNTKQKIIHFARFDVAIIKYYMGITIAPVYCTKTASKLARTFTDRHSFKDLCRDLLSQDISKQQQSSDWGADTLSQEQIDYAAADVLYLHALRAKLEEMLTREGHSALVRACCDFIPARAELDLLGMGEVDIFQH